MLERLPLRKDRRYVCSLYIQVIPVFCHHGIQTTHLCVIYLTIKLFTSHSHIIATHTLFMFHANTHQSHGTPGTNLLGTLRLYSSQSFPYLA